MQSETVKNNHEDVEPLPHADMASFYHTKWLMAHNRLHAIVHEPSASPAEEWNAYLSELKSAEEVARHPI
jgi:hypothetical protein